MLNNNIDWEEIYEDTWWGIGVSTNSINWGIVYYDNSQQESWNFQSSYYNDEVDNWNNI